MLRWLARLVAKWRSRRLQADIEAGRVLRGRQPESKGGGRLPTKTEPRGTISARVYRAATGEWEDLGVISRPEV